MFYGFTDYVGFIKKIIKLMQNKYHQLKLLEVELRQEETGPPPPGLFNLLIIITFQQKNETGEKIEKQSKVNFFI